MYCDQAGMIERFGEDELLAIADRDGDGVIDASVVAQAIDDAGAEIDSYLGVRYALPLSTVPAVIVRLCADIARYRLMDARPLDEAKERYDEGVRFLRDVSAGKAMIQAAGEAPVTTDFQFSARRTEADRTFSRDTLAGY